MPELRNPPVPASDRLMKQAAAARRIGVARSTIMTMAGRGDLDVEKVDGVPMIVRASVDAFIAERAARGAAATAA